MAKTKAQTRTMLRNMITMFDNGRDHLVDEFMANYDTVKSAIDTGDPAAAFLMHEKLEDLADAANEYWVAHRAFMRTINYLLGELAGVEDPLGDEATNISAFNEYLIDNSEDVVDLGLTKTAFSAGGSNVGDSVVIEINDGPDGEDMEAAHNETLQLKCVSLSSSGRPQWSLSGSSRKRFLFDPDMGTGNVKGGYLFNWGTSDEDWSPQIKLARTNPKPVLVEWDGSDQRNMVINGDFSKAIGSSGNDDKVPGATINSGESNVGYETSSPIEGDNSLEFDGDVEMDFPLIGGNRVGLPLFASVWIQRVGSFAGTFNLKVVSGPNGSETVHETATESIGGLTAGVDTHKSVALAIPDDVGENPRIRLETTGTSGGGSLLIDKLVGGLATLFDSNRAIAIVSGVTRSVRGDVHDGQNAISSATPFQRMFVEIFGRSVAHSASGTYWTP